MDEASVQPADLVAFFLPMHTATRMALPLIDRRAPRAILRSHICAYGLYAPLNDDMLRERGVQTVLGPEFEEALRDLANRLSRAPDDSPRAPDRPADRAASGLQDARSLGSAAARTLRRAPDRRRTSRSSVTRRRTRGCKHRCRHCPIVPVYDGRFRVVPSDVVLADIAAQVAAGAQHITFGDPDFFNGPRHAMAHRRGAARAPIPASPTTSRSRSSTCCQHRDAAPAAARHRLRLRHERGGVVRRCRARVAGQGAHARGLRRGSRLLPRRSVSTSSPTFVAFTPWTTMESYALMLARRSIA